MLAKFWRSNTQDRESVALGPNYVQIWARLGALQLKHPRHAEHLSRSGDDHSWNIRIWNRGWQGSQLSDRVRRDVERGYP